MKLYNIEGGQINDGRDATQQEISNLIDFIVSRGRDREEVEQMNEDELRLAYAQAFFGV